MQVKGFLLAATLGCLVSFSLSAAQDSELQSARKWIVDQPHDFSNEVLFERRGQTIVRFARFTRRSEMFGDFDGDGDVDQYDYNAMHICLSYSGPGVVTVPACLTFDTDDDEDIDLVDTHQFQNAYTGSEDAPVCIVDADCDDANPCTTDTCAVATDECIHYDVVCPLGQTCNGNTGNCQVVTCTSNGNCNDIVSCTADTCNLGTGLCVFTAIHTACNDGLFCNGTEGVGSCNPNDPDAEAGTGCVRPGNPCANPTPACNEGTNSTAQTGLKETWDTDR